MFVITRIFDYTREHVISVSFTTRDEATEVMAALFGRDPSYEVTKL